MSTSKAIFSIDQCYKDLKSLSTAYKQNWKIVNEIKNKANSILNNSTKKIIKSKNNKKSSLKHVISINLLGRNMTFEEEKDHKHNLDQYLKNNSKNSADEIKGSYDLYNGGINRLLIELKKFMLGFLDSTYLLVNDDKFLDNIKNSINHLTLPLLESKYSDVIATGHLDQIKGLMLSLRRKILLSKSKTTKRDLSVIDQINKIKSNEMGNNEKQEKIIDLLDNIPFSTLKQENNYPSKLVIKEGFKKIYIDDKEFELGENPQRAFELVLKKYIYDPDDPCFNSKILYSKITNKEIDSTKKFNFQDLFSGKKNREALKGLFYTKEKGSVRFKNENFNL